MWNSWESRMQWFKGSSCQVNFATNVKGGEYWHQSRPCLALAGAYGVAINAKGGGFWTFCGVQVAMLVLELMPYEGQHNDWVFGRNPMVVQVLCRKSSQQKAYIRSHKMMITMMSRMELHGSFRLLIENHYSGRLIKKSKDDYNDEPYRT